MIFLQCWDGDALHVDVDVSSGFIYWCDFNISRHLIMQSVESNPMGLILQTSLQMG